MTNPLYKRYKAIGYTRLSTNLQLERDDSLNRQAARIREACASQGWDLLRTFEDVASAVGKGTASQRPGLRDALSLAKSEGAILVVTEPTRLFRNRSEGLKAIRAHGVKVFSVDDNRLLSREELGAAFKAGEEFAETVRLGSSDAALRRNMPTAHLPKAAAASRRARALKSAEIADAIADAFERDPLLHALTHKALAEELNRLGILSGWKRPWNAASVRNQRKRACETLKNKKALEAENDEFSPEASPPVLFSRPDMNNAAIPAIQIVPSIATEPEEAETEKFGDHRDSPTFGMF